MEATVLVRAVHYADIDPPAVLVYVHIECEACGEYTMVLHGHHLVPVIQALQEVAGANPALAAAAGEILARPAQTIRPESN